MRYQRLSETTRKGNGQSHTIAVQNVIDFLKLYKKDDTWSFTDEYLVRFDPKWCRKDGVRLDYEHSYDIAIMLPNGLGRDVYAFIEVDGKNHSKQRQRLNDQRAERYAEHMKKPIVRLDKSECLGLPADVDLYLRAELKNFIK